MICSIEGCGRKHYARSLCQKHYTRQWVAGNIPKLVHRSLDERIEEKLERIPEAGCWIWMGSACGRYASISLGRAKPNNYLHRMMLERKLGRPLGVGMRACHTCDIPLCINPYHLFEGTAQQNSMDAYLKGRLKPPVPRRGNDHWKRQSQRTGRG